MDRFHGLWLTGALVVVGLGARLLPRRIPFDPGRRWFGILLGLTGIFLVLAFGDQLPVSPRRWLAGWGGIFVWGRFPGSEAALWATLTLVAASAVVLEAVVRRYPRATLALGVLVALDFLAVQAVTQPLRWAQARGESFLGRALPALPTRIVPAQVGAPRRCDVSPGITYQPRYHTGEFAAWGSSPTVPLDYRQGRLRRPDEFTQIVCGSGWLLDAATLETVEHRVVDHTPVQVRLEVALDGPGPRELLWAEQTDGLWELSVDGTPAPLGRGPYGLRRFALVGAGTHRVAMDYRGPLSRWWR